MKGGALRAARSLDLTLFRRGEASLVETRQVAGAFLEQVYVQRHEGRDLLVLIAGDRAIVAYLDGPSRDGGTLRHALGAAIRGVGEGAAPSLPAGQSQPINLTVNFDLDQFRAVGTAASRSRVLRDTEGRIVGMESTSATVTDHVRKDGA